LAITFSESLFIASLKNSRLKKNWGALGPPENSQKLKKIELSRIFVISFKINVFLRQTIFYLMFPSLN